MSLQTLNIFIFWPKVFLLYVEFVLFLPCRHVPSFWVCHLGFSKFFFLS